MQKELLNYIRENNISPFNKEKLTIKSAENIYETTHASAVHSKIIRYLSKEFNFEDSEKIFNALPFVNNVEEIKRRQDFFKKIEQKEYSFLKHLKKNAKKWHPPYGVMVVTANESTFISIKNLDCPVKMIISQSDVTSLENYDVIQAIDVEEYQQIFEQLDNVVFVDSLDELYLERYIIQLSEWKDIIEMLKLNELFLDKEMISLITELSDLLHLLNDLEGNKISRENIEKALQDINYNLSNSLKTMTLTGEDLIKLMSKGSLPIEITNKINQAINSTGLPALIFTKTIPINLDEEEIDKIIKKQDAQKFTKRAEMIQDKMSQLIKIPEKVQRLSDFILYLDFISGISKYINKEMNYPEFTENILEINQVLNILMENAQPISFLLNKENRCSILTGANSGGKTTLLEHIIQINSISQLGLPLIGKAKIPLFSEAYYFAKTKGSANKGAFETLLTQMSEIKPGNKTIILADEIEAVTEPGVAGKIISATADYFIKKNCFLIIATHLGQDIEDILPTYARIDGIEAKGLDEEFNLIVDHNPVLGRLAHSTPELIVEKMAKSKKKDYFEYLFSYLTAHKKESQNNK